MKILKNHLYSKVKTRGDYDSFDEALSKSRSYNDSELAEYVFLKTLYYSKTLSGQTLLNPSTDFLMLVSLLLSTCKRRINVVDFGGGAGKHYYETKSFLNGYGISLSWNIIETKTMCSICKTIESKELNYFESIDTFADNNKNEIDIVFSDSVIPFLRDPYETLKRLINLNSHNLLLSRIHTTINEDVISIQTSKFDLNGPVVSNYTRDYRKASYPIRILSSFKIENIIRKNYNIKILTEKKNAYICNWQSFGINTYYCKRKLINYEPEKL